jgi:LacI family repressor for deo operon, udp, cdd, tsx, nupC, and nupG
MCFLFLLSFLAFLGVYCKYLALFIFIKVNDKLTNYSDLRTVTFSVNLVVDNLKKMTTIKQVAEHSGVSVATVSRALQHPDKVAKKTREKIIHSVKLLDYKPNLMAVKFRSGKSHNIIVLVPTIANLFFARVIAGMQEAAMKQGYSILLANTLANPSTESEYAKMVQTSQADGLIQLRAFNPFTQTDAQSIGFLPMVNVCEVLDDINCPTVALNNQAASKTMTDYLISIGHKRIGLVKGPQSSPLTLARLAGYREALANANIPFDEELLFSGDFTLKAGRLAGQRILECKQRPTAVFCENDETAIGAIQAFKQAGLRVPQDISVAGFDDIAFAGFCDPPLTTISQPAEDFGRTAVNLLIDLITEKKSKQTRVTMPFELILRQSTQAIDPNNFSAE